MPRIFQKKKEAEKLKIPEPPSPIVDKKDEEEKISVVTENWLVNNKLDYIINRIEHLIKLIESELKE